jgi:D-alanyl-D-alanine carboxypeptidase/D-alanyl-D-alanine-endopeptidase (penicillin-binding protein 4)
MKKYIILLAGILIISSLSIGGCNKNNGSGQPIPEAISKIINDEFYSQASWSLKVVDLDTGELIYQLNPEIVAFTGSVRKLFSAGLALNELGPDFRFNTPVYRTGPVDAEGVLEGNLVLVASGDLTLGGRNTQEGTIAYTDFDHIDANQLGSAVLTPEDPLGGINKLAEQVADSGVKVVNGDVIIDDRLFDQFVVPNNERVISPIVINDNLVDVTVLPTAPGEPADVICRPQSAAFTVESEVLTVEEGGDENVRLSTSMPTCIGAEGCNGTVTGQIPVGFKPGLLGVETLVQTFKIDNPTAYARTVFIEALEKAGVSVNTNLIGPNPKDKLPPEGSYTPQTLVAEFISLPFSETIKLVLKVSHNYGANLNLILYGVTQGVKTVHDALQAERETLIKDFGINGDSFNFPTNGSGSPDSQASPDAIIKLLTEMRGLEVFEPYFDSFPILGEDGSLATVGKNPPPEPPNPVIAQAFGQVFAKTGTTAGVVDQQIVLVAQNFAGYIDSKSGRRLAYVVMVNNVGAINDVSEILRVFNDQGEISALIFKEN